MVVDMFQIKAYLESRDIGVWMDDGGVSSIDCLHSALEGSTAVLACITDHYRDSPQNRAGSSLIPNIKSCLFPLT